MDDGFDCIIVGGGIAGLSAAMVLAESDCSFILLERGEFFGSKNVSGGVLWGKDLSRLVPGFEDDPDAYERFINHRRLAFLDEDSSFSIDFKTSRFDERPYQGVSVLRARFDAWLAGKVDEKLRSTGANERSLLATNVLVDALVKEDGCVRGITAGGDVIRSRAVILAEGANNLLTRSLGIEDDYVPASGMSIGLKEVLRIERRVLEDRFQLNGRSGVACEFLGFSTQGLAGGGFLYTNDESVSLGLVIDLEDLRASGMAPYDLLDTFKAHPTVRDMIRGSVSLEYSAHTVSSGGFASIPKRLVADGAVVAGEAAHLLLNSGRAIHGMDYAMRSGILAAEAVLASLQNDDVSSASLSEYQRSLDRSDMMAELKAFEGAVKLMHDSDTSTTLPNVLCQFGYDFFNQGAGQERKASAILRSAVKDHSSYVDMLKLGYKLARHL